jgi:hypothetical protein
VSLLTEVRKILKLGHSFSELEPYLAEKEILFEAPPLTPELLAAIKKITPQFHLRPDEQSRRFWQLNQNGACWGEYEALAPYLDNLDKPERVLDIGPGLGRSTVFFKKVEGWQDVPFHLYEGSGSKTKYTRVGPRFDDSFCGDIQMLRSVLDYNRIESVEIFDAAELGARLEGLPGPYDFIYSFFAIGFHWSIGHFLAELLDLMHAGSIGAFTLHDEFEDFSELGDTPHVVVDFRRSWPRNRTTRMLVLAKSEAALRP